MDNSILTETTFKFIKLREILHKLKEQDNINYGKILDINKRNGLTEDEWKIKQVIAKFENKLDHLHHKYNVINEKIQRGIVKIFLFGKVSVGKSALLNAILGDIYFASGITHTTNSFVHVKLSEDGMYKIKTKNKEETFDEKVKFIEQIECLSGNIKDTKTHVNETIEVSICIDDNKILKEGIEIVDCPGSGNKSEITDCIKKNSEDADIFIFVLNYALTDEDKVFFKYQSEFSTKPDVFIVINSWDDTDNDDDEATKMSQNKILEECSTFFENLGMTNQEKILERIYFVSAFEMCQIRINNDNSFIDSSATSKNRLKEFERLEYNLSKYIQNPHNNKSRRYKQEIKQLLVNLYKEIKKFEIEIFQEKNESLITKYKNLIDDLEKYKETIKMNCEADKELIIKKMNAAREEIQTNPNLLNREWLLRELEHYNIDLNKSLDEATKKRNKEFINFLKSKEGLDEKSKLSKSGNPIKRNMWNSVIINTKDEGSVEGNVINDALEKLTILPIPNIKFQITVYSLSVIGKFLEQKLKESEIENQKQNIIQQLNSKKESISVNIEKNMKEICDFYIDRDSEVIRIFQEKIMLFKEYWKELEHIFKEIHDDFNCI